MTSNYNLNATDSLTMLLKQEGITRWDTLIQYVKQLPYGRTLNRTDLSLVISQHKGTCSSKHALLKTIADANGLRNVKLILGIYKMNTNNTPKIGKVLEENALEYIPEAHCYLCVNGKRQDYTTPQSHFTNIEDAILIEKEIKPHQVGDFKIEFHKSYINQWIKDKGIAKNFNSIWTIRELCIQNLSL